MEAIGYLAGGMGLFFVGLHLLSSGLRQMTGRRFLLCIAKWLGTGAKATISFAACPVKIHEVKAEPFNGGAFAREYVFGLRAQPALERIGHRLILTLDRIYRSYTTRIRELFTSPGQAKTPMRKFKHPWRINYCPT